MDLEDAELYIVEGRQLKELFNCVLCKTKLKKGSSKGTCMGETMRRLTWEDSASGWGRRTSAGKIGV